MKENLTFEELKEVYKKTQRQLTKDVIIYIVEEEKGITKEEAKAQLEA